MAAGSGWGTAPQAFGGLGARGSGARLGPGPPWQAGRNSYGGLGAHRGTGGLTGQQFAQGVPTKPAAAPSTTPPSGAAPGGGTAAAAPSPYDSTYYIDLANATAKAQGQIGNYQANIANGATNLQNTLHQLAYNQTISNRNAQNSENARGGFAQGALGNTLGQIAHNTQQTGSNAALKYSQDAAAWNAAIEGVNQGLSLETIALGLASAARQPAPGDPGTGSAAAPAGAPGAAAPGPAPGGGSTPGTLNSLPGAWGSSRAPSFGARGRGPAPRAGWGAHQRGRP